MRVKKFEAKSMKEALQMVKQELGPDAVILAARDNRKSFGLGGAASVEITAAVSEGTLQKKQFAQSRLSTATRATFDGSSARVQKQAIDSMVEKRRRRDEDEARAAAPRKPITSMSYIDIPDDVEESPRRSNAFANAAGRNVDELLGDFDQRLRTENRSESRGGARQAPRQQQQQQQPQPPRRDLREELESTVSDRAVARIRNAAREAWKNNPFMDEQPARQTAPQRQAQSPQQTQPLRNVASQSFANNVASITSGRSVTPPGGYDRATTAHAVAQAAAAQVRSETPPPRRFANGGLEVVQDYQFEDESDDQPEAFRHVAIAPNADVTKLKGEIQRLEQMLEGFQKVPQSFTSLHPGADYGIGYDFSFMFQKLTEAGVSVENAAEILKQAEKEIDPGQAKKRPIVDAWVARWFLTHVKVAENPFQGRLHLFVGGSGSGKTTTLVKMAAQLVVKEKKKVAILSLDSTKVGAIDQMKIYCQILNVPFAVVRNKQDWEWIMTQLRHVDHILVDYPGMNLRDVDEIHSLKAMLPPSELAPITHLCVSATSKDGDANELASRYKVAEPNDVIFTNLDQSVQHGVIYNLQRRTGLPLHSFGIGNRIPEDFEKASKERVLDLIFKLTKLRRDAV